MRKDHGFSLPELLVVLALLAVLAALAGPRLVGARDAYAVRAARDAAAALVERARSLAASRGAARLIVDAPKAELRLESPPGVVARAPLAVGDAFGIELTIDGNRSSVVPLDFNALGLGMLANRTLRFRRGGREAGLSLSTYGRARRW